MYMGELIIHFCGPYFTDFKSLNFVTIFYVFISSFNIKLKPKEYNLTVIDMEFWPNRL